MKPEQGSQRKTCKKKNRERKRKTTQTEPASDSRALDHTLPSPTMENLAASLSLHPSHKQPHPLPFYIYPKLTSHPSVPTPSQTEPVVPQHTNQPLPLSATTLKPDSLSL